MGISNVYGRRRISQRVHHDRHLGVAERRAIQGVGAENQPATEASPLCHRSLVASVSGGTKTGRLVLRTALARVVPT